MRENESDGDGTWPQPPGYASPWTPREEARREEDPRTRWPAGPLEEDGYPDTLAFGTPIGSPGAGSPGAGSPGAGSPGQAWYGNQAGSGYGNQAGSGYGNQPGYGNQGWYPNQGGNGDPAGHRADGGSGRGGRLLVYVAVAALAASIGAGVTVALGHHGATPAAGVSSGDVPGPHDNASGSGASAAALDPAAVEKKVDPGLVDIVATLKYNGETAEGTGMIISSDGLVLTNNHVIDQATKVRATLVTQGGSATGPYTARVLGYDAADDVALLQLVGASGLPVESFGNSSQVSLGTPVLALGNAEGRGGAKPARGIINALDRSIQASDEGSNTTENLKHMLQTNARIQQGDSGGALANNAGQVIGMVTAADTGSSRSAGHGGGTLGFAIPINSALAIARQIAAGKPSATVYIGVPGFLGVEVATSDSQDPRQQAADESGGRRAVAGAGSACQTTNQQAGAPRHVASVAAGALIVGVLCETAAASAGMAPGDVITAVNGQPVTTPSSLTDMTAKYHPNDVVSVLWVSLDGTEHTTRMQLGEGPAR